MEERLIDSLLRAPHQALAAELCCLPSTARDKLLAALQEASLLVESLENVESDTDDEWIDSALGSSLGDALDAYPDPLDKGTSSEEEEEDEEETADEQQRQAMSERLELSVGLPFGRLQGELGRGPLGLVADVQFGAGLKSKQSRWYEETLATFGNAIHEFNRIGCIGMLLLGDQIDMRDHNGDGAASKMFEAARQFHCVKNIGMVLGNHDGKHSRLFKNARQQGGDGCGGPVASAFCYEFHHWGEDGSRWHFLALDPYSCLKQEAPDSAIDESFKSKMDGAIGPAQMEWLRTCLEAAQTCGANVALLSHAAFHWRNGRKSTRCVKNATEVRNLLHRFPCVKLVLAGHAHAGAYHCDSSGVHHLTLRACLNTPPGTPTGAILRLFTNYAEITFLAHPKRPLKCLFRSPDDSRIWDKKDGDPKKNRKHYLWQWDDHGSWKNFSHAQQIDLTKGYRNRSRCLKFVLPNTDYKAHFGKQTVMDMKSKKIYTIRCILPPCDEARNEVSPDVCRNGCGPAARGYHYCCRACARRPGQHDEKCRVCCNACGFQAARGYKYCCRSCSRNPGQHNEKCLAFKHKT